MDKLSLTLPWNQTGSFYKPGSSRIAPYIVTVNISFDIDETRYVLSQKKDMGWPVMPGAKTCFGGRIEEGESSSEAALREMREELGLEFTKKCLESNPLVELFDMVSGWRTDKNKCQRVFALDFGVISYEEWLEYQKLITLSEGIGFEAVALTELEKEYAESIYVPHDRDTLGAVIKELSSE